MLIARHGERIDCIDELKNNQELSEYDPELTKKGIKQAKDIGTQIKKSLKKCLTILFSYDRIALTFAKRKLFLNLVNMDEETDARTAVIQKI